VPAIQPPGPQASAPSAARRRLPDRLIDRMSTQRERDAEKRKQKMRDIDEAVEEGRLVIRKMTPAERKRFPARDERPRKRGR
jgi:hypothetical protein